MRLGVGGEALQFIAEAEVAGVAESWYDIFMFVESWVDGGAPDCGLVLGQRLFHMFDTIGCGDDAADVDTAWDALGEKRLIP